MSDHETLQPLRPSKDHCRHIVERARLRLVATSDDTLLALPPRFAPRDARDLDSATR